jgi:transcriptional regulator GlxA family with amidase domain
MIQSEGHVLIEKARRWLNQRLDQPWALPELAEHCHTSQRTLARRFVQVLGCTTVAYVQQLRVERAKALLESTQMSLQEITGRCGYEDVSTFSKIFKRRTQLTPREYKSRFCVRA